jgi:nucleoid-associated protein YgaU
MSRTVFGLVAIGAAVIAIALAWAWRGKLTEQAAIDRPAGQGAPTAPAAERPAPTASAPPAAAPAPSIAMPAPVAAPTFDVARIGPDGRAVIAGRATPGAKIVLLDGGKEIAKAEADSRGEWVVIVQDPPLAVGQHELRVVQHIEGKAPVTSEQAVVALVPERPAESVPAKPREETLVVIAPQGGAATLVQPPSPAGVPKSADLALSTLDYDDRGHVTVTGQAEPGTVVRAYINDQMVAEGVAGPDGRWRLTPPATIEPGKHRLRLDRIAKDGKPVARLELPFDRVVVAPASSSDGRRLHVVRGDNLWNIAHAHYGTGFHYTVIFGANKDQIRDPHLIYPGQVFTLPNKVN